MSHPALSSLPLELHHGISFHLTDADSICLSLTCKRLYTIYTPQRLCASSRPNFWSMILSDDPALQKTMLKQWTTRNQVLPRLRDWTERVVDDAWTYWEICVGCATFKPYTKRWEDEWHYEDAMDEHPVFEPWLGKDWLTLEYYMSDGKFCESCCSGWMKLNAQRAAFLQI